MSEIMRHTFSVCPTCLKRIPAFHENVGGEVYLRKKCPDHGEFSAIIWRGHRDIDKWRGYIPQIKEGENENCPHGCGLCQDHRQETCCVLLEVTNRCNLNCAFCFADGSSGQEKISFETIKKNLIDLAVPGKTLVQLSGGEPTVREDLAEIIAAAGEAGCRYVQLNTNGIRLGESEEYVKELAEAGLSFVFMQFDGTDDDIYRKLRGRELLEIKTKAIENCGKYNLGVTLVPTLVPSVNIRDIGNIIKFAISKTPAVRGVHFQPVSYFGRIPELPDDHLRFTLDELLHEIESQAGDLVPMDTIFPSRCDHPMCGFHGDYIAMNDYTLYPLKKESGDSCCCGPQAGKIEPEEVSMTARKESSAEENRLFVARRWERTGEEAGKIDEDDNIETLDGFLRRVKSHSFTITAMAFQDAGNLDVERLRRCSLHVYDNGRHIPFCAYYLTAHTGS